MKKKYLTNTMLLSAAMLLAACSLGGCSGSSTNTVSIPRQSEPSEEKGSENNTETQEAPTDKATTTDDKTAELLSFDALNDFSYKLFAENMDEENPVLSPVSAYLALSMAGLGAENDTKTEFETVFGGDSDFSNVAAICDNLMTTLPTSSENNIVTLANSAWVDESFPISDSWLSDIDTIMHSEVFQRNLTSPDTMNSMNQWVAEKTNGLIDKMIDKPLSGRTGLVLFNTIYFKAKWEDSFEPHAVYRDKFYLENGDELDVELMHKESELDYLSNEFAEGVIFPYMRRDEQDGNFAFVALKPVDENTKVRELYEKLTKEVINEILTNKKTETVNTKLPKFEIGFDKELNESLIKMGLKDAFDVDIADFGKIESGGLTETGNGLYIDLVRQKAKIIVDEEGTEAAAVTSVIMECGAALPIEPPKEVFFDRPFVYIIMDMEKEIPLFIGILDRPTA